MDVLEARRISATPPSERDGALGKYAASHGDPERDRWVLFDQYTAAP